MGLVSLTCPTCQGRCVITLAENHTIGCLPCGGTGGVLVHTSSISGANATRVMTDDPWGKVWEQLDLFEPKEPIE